MFSESSVVVIVAEDKTTAHVEIENTDSGLTTIHDIQIGSIPSSIPLPGPGHYVIYIYLPSGDMYYGSFNY